MKKFALLLISCVSLAGCESTVSTLWLPMEPNESSKAAPRRELTEAEKDSISDAVNSKLKASTHRDFKWPPLVVSGRETDYCGLASGNDLDADYSSYSKYRARLAFDSRGKLGKVDVLGIAKLEHDNVATAVDSACMQEGYGVWPAVK